MLNKIIHYSLHNRLVVLCAAFLLLIAGTYTAMNTEVDVFPDLNAANIAVKLIQRFAKGAAYGHTLNGFKRPVADSSRGATVEEIVGDIAMLVLSAR